MMDIVRKWNIHYSKTNDPQDALCFLEQIEERANCYNIEKHLLPKAMPELLRHQALEWYRNNKQDWTTWKGFVKSFTDFFVPTKMKSQMENEIVAYVQKVDQPIQDYILRLQSLMRFAELSEADQLNRIYTNCRQEYKMYVKRHEFKTLSEFKIFAETFESITGSNKAIPNTQQVPKFRANSNNRFQGSYV